MGLQSIAEKDSRQDENCLCAHVARQRAKGSRLAELTGRWRDHTAAAGSHPGRQSLAEKNSKPDAASDGMALEYITAQLLITSHPLHLGNALGRAYVTPRFFCLCD